MGISTVWRATVFLLVALAAGCGGRSSRIWEVGGDGGAGEFCSGAAKLSLNSKPYTVTQVKGRALAMGCCDGAYVDLVARSSDGKAASVTVAIKAFGGSFTATEMDLANLPQGVELFVSYQPCSPPCSILYGMDSSRDTFAGKAILTGTPYMDLRVSLCLTAKAAGGDPNFADVTLWAGDVPIK